ncbi:hypothetical protein M0811_11055 [Anaeramoeba ignava]|uniref:Uncharacterized protein n=1 Tax=Anaeramoeba ignava TaxID=1746090 RepID=A0A9Q0R7U4_ANAIG|nr:hypothetical protein M0811_11055 [Anaeramoeba ignava]
MIGLLLKISSFIEGEKNLESPTYPENMNAEYSTKSNSHLPNRKICAYYYPNVERHLKNSSICSIYGFFISKLSVPQIVFTHSTSETLHKHQILVLKLKFLDLHIMLFQYSILINCKGDPLPKLVIYLPLHTTDFIFQIHMMIQEFINHLQTNQLFTVKIPNPKLSNLLFQLAFQVENGIFPQFQ